MEPSEPGGGGRVVVGEHKSSGSPQSFHSRVGQEGSTGGPRGFKLRKTRALLCRREMLRGGEGGVTGGAGSEVTHTRMMAFKSVLSRGHVWMHHCCSPPLEAWHHQQSSASAVNEQSVNPWFTWAESNWILQWSWTFSWNTFNSNQ